MPDSVRLPATESDQLLEVKAPVDELSEYLTDMRGKITQATTTRQSAFQRSKNNYQMYRGMIGRPLSDIPFEGASDIRYRLSTLYIRQTRAGFTNAVLNAPKLVRYTPKIGRKPVDQKAANDAADRQEAFSDSLYHDLLEDFHNTVDFCFSKLAIDGRAVAKVTWNIETRLVTEEQERQPFVDAIIQAQMAKYKQMMATVQQRQAQQRPSQQMPPGIGQRPGMPQMQGQPQQPPAQPTKKEIADADLTDDEIEQVVSSMLGWDENTERYEERIKSVLEQIHSEEDFIEVVTDKVISNAPYISILNYEDLIVPDDTTRISEAEWIGHKLRFSRRVFRAKDIKNGGVYKGAEELLDKDYPGATRDIEQRQMDYVKRRAEGLQDNTEKKDLVNVVELYCWIPRSWIKRFNKKTDSSPDLAVRAVITFVPEVEDNGPPEILRMIELPYHHGQWPFVDWFYNQTEKRFYENEGIVGLLWPLELEHNISRNAAINRSTLMMSPAGFYMEECGFQPQTHRQLGQMHAIDDQAWVASQGRPAGFMEYPPGLASMPEYDANNARQWASDIVGMPNIASLSGYSTAPTAEQVQQVVSPANLIQQHEIANWLDRWGRVYWMVHELCKQYLFLDGTKQIGFVNRDAQQNSVITKQDFDFEFIVRAGGDPSMESEMLLTQKRSLVMQQAVHNPALAPFIEFYDGWRTYVWHMLPPNEAAAWVPPRDKADQVNQTFQQMQAQAAAQIASGKRPAREQKNTMLQGAYTQIRPR